ncbi:hypothetical protein K2Z84_26185 [Candidatus Binatia bacterium]|nr:hypothetical protein [Candidatus Binatia bacterium]
MLAAQMLALRREQDRLAEILPLMQRDDYGAADIVPWTLPLALLDADRVDDARRAFARAWDLGLDAMPGENSRNRGLMVLGAMSLTCAGLGDVARAGELYARIAPRAGAWAMTSFGNVCFGLLANGAGALATTLGRWDDARAHFEQALAEHERTGHVVALARTCQLYATMLHARGRRPDRAPLRALIERGRALAATHDLVRVARTLARLEDRTSR